MKKSHLFLHSLAVLVLTQTAHLAVADGNAKSVIAARSPVAAAYFRSQREPGQTDHVVAHLEVGGETKYTDDGKTKREKMSVLCDLDYVEKTLEAPTDSEAVWRAARDYQKVSADVKVGDGQFRPTLKPEHRLIAVEAARQTTLLFSPGGSLTRDELDAIDIQANTLLLDRLLPEKAMAVGDRWPHSAELLAALLGLDEVAKTTVQSTLKEVTESVARFELTGRVEGTIYGVSTAIEIKARYRFDLQTKRIDWVGMLVKEAREGSFVDGVDAVSRLAIIITPVPTPASLSDEALAGLNLKPTPELLNLVHESSGGWRCTYDRRWYLHYDRPKNSVVKLRFVDGGTPLGECFASSLPQRDPEKLVSLEEFQEDVRRALGKSFGEFVEAGQSVSAANYRVYRVVVQGASAEIAMRWVYYLVADPQGRQVAFRFPIEQRLADRFAEADKPLVESLRFVENENQKKDHKDTESTEKKGERQRSVL